MALLLAPLRLRSLSDHRFTTAGAVNDYQKDLQFKKLNAQKDVIEVKVLRNGEDQLIGNEEVVVGDILLLDTGDKVCLLSVLRRASHMKSMNL